MTFEVQNITMTMESATGSGQTVLATYDPTESEMLAGWATFTISGDTTTVTNVYLQVYVDGEIETEAYVPGGDIEDLNEDLAETAPFEPASATLRFGCWGARINALNKGITAGLLQLLFMSTWNPVVFNNMVGVYVQYYGALLEVACECRNQCAEMAPAQSRFNGANLYHTPQLRTAPWAISIARIESLSCSLARGAV